MAQYIQLVSGILLQQRRVLLGHRMNTEYFPDYWALPCGRLEKDESFLDGLRRELLEEIGIQILAADNITTLFDHDLGVKHQVYRVTEWQGLPRNCEPQWCRQLAWYKLSALPSPLTPATSKILTGLARELC